VNAIVAIASPFILRAILSSPDFLKHDDATGPIP
jgi:hypothetical protein